jgi:hypothetical protein
MKLFERDNKIRKKLDWPMAFIGARVPNPKSQVDEKIFEIFMENYKSASGFGFPQTLHVYEVLNLMQKAYLKGKNEND